MSLLQWLFCPGTPRLDVPLTSHCSVCDLSSFTLNCCVSPGNAAVVKPSELSEFSSLLLRALLPRYLDKV